MVKTIKLNKDVYDKVKQISMETGMPMTQVINMLCNQWGKDVKIN